MLISKQRYITTAEAARLLGVSYQRIRSFIFTGVLRARQMPRAPWGRWEIDQQSVEELRHERGR